MKRVLFVAGSWVLLAGAVFAQDYPLIAPKTVAPIAPTAAVPAAPVPKSAPDHEVLLPKLKGLVFVAKPADIVTNGLKSKGVILKNVPVPDPEQFKLMAEKYLGRKLTRGGLNDLIRDVIVYYRQHNRPVVDVAVPEQDIATGTVQLIVLEGHLGKVTVTGNKWFSSKEVLLGVQFRAGSPIRTNQLQGDLDWLNANPFHSSSVIYHPGMNLGETDIELQTQDRFPARIYAGYENNGNTTTGEDRYEAGLNWGDAFHLGLNQQLNYQFTTSGDAQSLVAHAGSYVIPLPWQNTLTFFGSYTSTKGVVPPYIGINGRSYQISGRYSVPLPVFINPNLGLTYKHGTALGFDYKYNNNALEFGGLPAGGTLYSVQQFVVNYNGALTDPYGQTTLNENIYISPGGWGSLNNNAAFNAAHTFANSNYVYSVLALERMTRLPGDWSLILRGTLQNSNGNLVPSEQLGFGGYSTVRGYEEQEINTDEGFVFNTEIRTPSISFGELLGHPEFNDQLQFLGFWDYGAAHNHTLLPGEAYETPLSSIGAGLRYTINTYLSVRFDYGFQLINTGLDNDHGSHANAGVVLSY